MTSTPAEKPAPTEKNSRRVLFLRASARHDGNAELLARHAAATLPATTEQTWIRLADADLGPFSDIRHVGTGIYPAPRQSAQGLLDATLAATDLVFVAPVYWYGLPADAKLYLDHWSGWMRIPGLDFRARMAGKALWAISVFSGDDAAEAAPLFETLRPTAEYMKMQWRGAVLGRGNRPGDVFEDQQSVEAARRLFT